MMENQNSDSLRPRQLARMHPVKEMVFAIPNTVSVFCSVVYPSVSTEYSPGAQVYPPAAALFFGHARVLSDGAPLSPRGARVSPACSTLFRSDALVSRLRDRVESRGDSVELRAELLESIPQRVADHAESLELLPDCVAERAEPLESTVAHVFSPAARVWVRAPPGSSEPGPTSPG